MIDPQIGTLAKLWKRLVGAIIDTVVSLPPVLILMTMIGLADDDTWGSDEQIAFFVLCWIVFLVLHGYLLVTRGQTIGKLILRMRIVDESGSLQSPARLIGLRYFVPSLVFAIPFIGTLVAFADILLIFRKSRQRLVDTIAGTYVIED